MAATGAYQGCTAKTPSCSPPRSAVHPGRVSVIMENMGVKHGAL